MCGEPAAPPKSKPSRSTKPPSSGFAGSIRTLRIGPATVLEIEVRESSTLHTISLQQMERWLGGATMKLRDAARTAKLKTLLIWK